MDAAQRASWTARRQQIARDRDTLAGLVQQYRDSWDAMRADLRFIFDQLKVDRAAGDVDASWIYQDRRLSQLQAIARDYAAMYGKAARAVIAEQMRVAFLDAQAAAYDAMQAGINADHRVAFNAPDDAVLVRLVKNADTPSLRRLFDRFGVVAAKRAKTAMIAGLASGQSVDTIARMLKAALGVNMSKALTISRTETMNTFRNSSLETFRANSNVVREWEWMAGPDACDFCESMAGKHFSLSTPFNTHPNCRCCPSPVTVSYADILASAA